MGGVACSNKVCFKNFFSLIKLAQITNYNYYSVSKLVAVLHPIMHCNFFEII